MEWARRLGATPVLRTLLTVHFVVAPPGADLVSAMVAPGPANSYIKNGRERTVKMSAQRHEETPERSGIVENTGAGDAEGDTTNLPGAPSTTAYAQDGSSSFLRSTSTAGRTSVAHGDEEDEDVGKETPCGGVGWLLPLLLGCLVLAGAAIIFLAVTGRLSGKPLKPDEEGKAQSVSSRVGNTENATAATQDSTTDEDSARRTVT